VRSSWGVEGSREWVIRGDPQESVTNRVTSLGLISGSPQAHIAGSVPTRDEPSPVVLCVMPMSWSGIIVDLG
jgi:hypothetical protein